MRPGAKNLFQRISDVLVHGLRWLKPGLGVKRWFGFVFVGITLLAVGFAVLILDVYRTAPDSWWLPIISAMSLRFLARPLRALIFGLSGVLLVALGFWGFNRTLLKPFVKPGRQVLDTVTAYRKKDRGPKIVVIGGGTGLSALLRGLKQFTNNLTAIVTVADDGGSSGELRRNIGILPPGDIRNCLAALSDNETLLTQVFQYRFGAGAGLNGHSLGNLLITALTDVTGSFEEAIAESGRVLAVQGRVLPSTLHDVRLVADVVVPNGGEIRVDGESQIPKAAGQISRVWLEPNNPLAYPPTLQALLSADLIIVGPGSLYTSILPNLLVPDLADAIRSSRAQKFYICNIATQPGETDGYTADDHLDTIEKHLGEKLFDLAICNNVMEGNLPNGASWVGYEASIQEKYPVYFADLEDNEYPWRHDSKKVSKVVMDLFYERTGPLAKDEN